MPDFTQNFNRYSYALNNPLRYRDESGEFFIVDSILIGLISGGLKRAGKMALNDIKIWGGLFVGDPKKSFGGKVWEHFSRSTWQLLQVTGGFLTAHAYNTFLIKGEVESVDYKYGATVLKTSGSSWGAVTQGSYIIGDNSIAADAENSLFQHEYGHYIQSQKIGLFYYFEIGIPSIVSAAGEGDHRLYYTEQDANTCDLSYFNKNIEAFSDEQGTKWNFVSHPITSLKTSDIHGDFNDVYRKNDYLIPLSLKMSVRKYPVSEEKKQKTEPRVNIFAKIIY